MLLAFAGDWHANNAWAVTAIRYAADHGVELIIHTGDYGYRYEPRFVEQVEAALEAASMELWFVDGNHDMHPFLDTLPDNRVSPRVHHIPRGRVWELEGLRFQGVGGAVSVDREWRTPGLSWWPEEMITNAQIAFATSQGVVDVLVSHDCPAGVTIPRLGEDGYTWPEAALVAAAEHRQQLRRIVDVTRPRYLWHGHYHRWYRALGPEGLIVTGLDMDGTTMELNLDIVDLEKLR